MAITRRELVKAAAVAGIAATIPGGSVASFLKEDDPASEAARVRGLRQDDYSRLVDEWFEVRDGASRTDLQLVAVSDLGKQGHGGRACGDCFSLVFASRAPLAQGTYRVSHPMTGAATLLLVPVVSRGPLRVQAIFNRVHSQAS